MWNKFPPDKFSLMEEMRLAIHSRLPEKAFLRRDRENGLFVSNAPVFDPEIREIPGFHIENTGKLIRIYPEVRWLRRLEDEYAGAADHFSLSLARFKGAEVSDAAMVLFCTGLKLLDAGEGAGEAEIALFDRNLRQLAARALRKDIPGGGLYTLSLLDEMLKKCYNRCNVNF